jgi:hypothetical protein
VADVEELLLVVGFSSSAIIVVAALFAFDFDRF